VWSVLLGCWGRVVVVGGRSVDDWWCFVCWGGTVVRRTQRGVWLCFCHMGGGVWVLGCGIVGCYGCLLWGGGGGEGETGVVRFVGWWWCWGCGWWGVVLGCLWWRRFFWVRCWLCWVALWCFIGVGARLGCGMWEGVGERGGRGELWEVPSCGLVFRDLCGGVCVLVRWGFFLLFWVGWGWELWVVRCGAGHGSGGGGVSGGFCVV